MNKKSMSVTEMRLLLGIGKTDSYWLVKKGYFETVIIAGKMRVMVDSFEKWYDNQLHYRKVDGTPPEKNWTGITFSVREVAEMLGISDSSVYELLKKKVFCTARVGLVKLVQHREAPESLLPSGVLYFMPSTSATFCISSDTPILSEVRKYE